jgi:4-carboxymuconolactone decarboxylase
MEDSRIEKIAECGLRNGNVSSAKPTGLDPHTVALVRIATAIATGEDGALRQRMMAARGAGVAALAVEELLLQSLLNIGYPLTLVAFAVWREVAGPITDAGEPLDHAEWERWRTRGEEVCAQVYGRTFHKLLLNLRALHPALERLVVVDAYGKVLGRPGLDPRRRELCTLAAIAMLNAPRQLHAHLRGALNTGSSREDVDAVLALVEADLSSERALKVWELWADVRGRSL